MKDGSIVDNGRSGSYDFNSVSSLYSLLRFIDEI